MQNRYKIRFSFCKRLLFFAFASVSSVSVYADCAPPPILPQVDIHFYEYNLGRYTIDLTPTLSAIKSQQVDSEKPYYQKSWYGDCPGGLSGSAGSCIEYTVYPDSKNFSPGDIMDKIEQYTDGGDPNRGEVRILTDADKTQYVYTLDHERTFCGPYPLK